jgi:hypothetical protein
VSKIIVSFGLLLTVATLTGCKGQSTATPEKPKDLASSVEAVQAAASHVGDEGLSCEAIQREFSSVMNDPAIHAYVAQSGMEAQNAEWARVMAAQAGTPVQRVQTAQKQMERMSDMAAQVMPQVARAQRLMELSLERKCAWIVGAQAYPPNANDGHP